MKGYISIWQKMSMKFQITTSEQCILFIVIDIKQVQDNDEEREFHQHILQGNSECRYLRMTATLLLSTPLSQHFDSVESVAKEWMQFDEFWYPNRDFLMMRVLQE